MRNERFIQSMPLDAKVSYIERVMQRLIRRRNTQSVVLTPPQQVSGVTREDGEIFSTMFPLNGSIGSCYIRYDGKLDKIVKVSLEVPQRDMVMIKQYVLKDKLTSVSTNCKFSAGDIASVHVSGMDKEGLDIIWVALIWYPTANKGKVEKFLLDNLDEENEEFVQKLNDLKE